ncbi:MAG: NUDIX domain-containing protein [Williamsia sp.]|nr:NUDIX domain-containing protein [Williamsia sp.]
MHYKIYFDQKPIFLLDTPGPELTPYLDKPKILFVNGLSPSHLHSAFQNIRSEKTDAVIYYHEPLSELKEAFWDQFTVIQAGGGLVINERGEILFIFRRGRWDLPKGKLDPGETLPACALREVEEETGLSGLTLEKELLVTYHTYQQDGEEILKETYWYQMTADSKTSLTAQTEEDILEVKWIRPDQLGEVLSNTYQAIRDVLDSYRPEN